MKTKKILMFIITLLMVVAVPNKIKAAEVKYNTLNFKEALAEEEIEELYPAYKETGDQITIYLFRGKGCGYCRAYLQFMNSIAEEYGKYFKMVSYEVWNDSTNAKLLTNVSNYLNEPASGVPYIIIGEKVFGGYADVYDEDIKQAIMDLYNTKKNKRYDVMKEMEKNPDKTSGGSISNNQIWTIIICNLIFTIIASLLVMSHFNNKFNLLYQKMADLKNNETKEVKETKTKKTSKK